ncbi:MAG: hypothetical protein PHR92_18110 [Lachnospiraceae bacterium]|nr:hypothetical protein [Lachnospiraceae bacterium]
MDYKKLSNNVLSKYKYPNLIAELIESHCSICTLGDYMGLEGARKENDAEVWGKLQGSIPIMANEAVGLAGLFGVSMQYLFSDKLKLLYGEPMAVVHWLDYNRKMEKEFQDREQMQVIERELKKRPELKGLLSKMILLNDSQIQKILDVLG